MIRDQLVDALASVLSRHGVAAPDPIGLERPARREHGDWSSNVAMVTARTVGRPPREWAADLVADLEQVALPHVTGVEVAGPGFINFRLADSWLHEVVGEVVAAGPERFGRREAARPQRVIVEFVSANPTGPIHAGHGRGAVYGDVVARLVEAVGHSVEREFYINDRGIQMELFAASLAARRAGEEPPDDGYRGHYIREWAALMPPDADPLEWGYVHALEAQRTTLARLGITFDTWFSERSMVASGAIDETLADLASHGVTYEADGAVWLRSTDYGDDKDRVLVKSDGHYTYLLPDIAYHRDKFSRAERLVNVWGADHHGYVPRMKAAVAALGHDPAELEVVITQLVRLERNGEEVRLSKRTGDLVELAELVDELGPDAVRFTYLLQSVDSGQTVDLDLAASQVMENPVFYVQMAHARLCSIASTASERGVERRPLDEVDLGVLVHDRELEVLRRLFEFGEIVAVAAADRAPHRVTAWSRELAAAVHGFYHDCYVMGEGIDPELTQARLWLCEAARIGLAAGLGLVGVTAPEAM